MSTLHSDNRLWQAAAATALVLPALAVMGVRTFAPHMGPATARGSETTAPLTLQGIINRPYTDEHRKLASTIAAVDQQPFAASPLRLPTLAVDPTSHIPINPLPGEPSIGDPAKLFTLTSIAGTAEQPLAVINGKVRALGAPLGEGWSLLEVSFATGSIDVRHDTGPVATLTLPKPALKSNSPTEPPAFQEEPR